VQGSFLMEDCSRSWRRKPKSPFADGREVERRYCKLVGGSRPESCGDGTSVTRDGCTYADIRRRCVVAFSSFAPMQCRETTHIKFNSTQLNYYATPVVLSEQTRSSPRDSFVTQRVLVGSAADVPNVVKCILFTTDLRSCRGMLRGVPAPSPIVRL